MSGGEWAAIIGGIAGFISTMYGVWRVARADKLKSGSDNAAVLLGGWRDFQAETLKEVERVRTSCQEQMDALRKEYDADREEWAKEKQAMQAEIETLKTQVLILIEQKTRGSQ